MSAVVPKGPFSRTRDRVWQVHGGLAATCPSNRQRSRHARIWAAACRGTIQLRTSGLSNRITVMRPRFRRQSERMLSYLLPGLLRVRCRQASQMSLSPEAGGRYVAERVRVPRSTRLKLGVPTTLRTVMSCGLARIPSRRDFKVGVAQSDCFPSRPIPTGHRQESEPPPRNQARA